MWTSVSSAKSSCSRWVLLQWMQKHHISFSIQSKLLLYMAFFIFIALCFNKINHRIYVELESNKLWVSLQEMTYPLEATLSKLMSEKSSSDASWINLNTIKLYSFMSSLLCMPFPIYECTWQCVTNPKLALDWSDNQRIVPNHVFYY